MRIISKFHDYYDAAAISHEKGHLETVCVRETKELSLSKKDDSLKRTLAFANRFGYNDLNTILSRIHICEIVCVAGKVFLIGQAIVDRRTTYFINEEILTAYNKNENIFSKSFIEFFKTLPTTVSVEVHAEVNAPVFRIRHWRGELTVETNPKLEYIDGLKQYLSAYQCAQRIEGYLGNEMANISTPKPLPISDKEKAETKGFDKHSFRAAPSKRKK